MVCFKQHYLIFCGIKKIIWELIYIFRHVQRKCRYSNVPDMYNLCELAHCREELDEWRERWEWRLLKREMAKQECLYSYMDQLLDEYQEAASGLTVVC